MRALIEEHYPSAEKVVLVMDNLNAHSLASFYEVFAPSEARRLTEKLEIHYTPKHGSWLNMAETPVERARSSGARPTSGVIAASRARSAGMARATQSGAGQDFLAFYDR